MSEIMLFVSAVAAHWLFTFGGIAMVGFGIWEKIHHKETAKWVFWGLASVLLLVAFCQAWSDEHHNAAVVISEKSAVWSQYNQCDKERAIKTSVVDTYSSELSFLRTRSDRQQDTFNRCIVALGVKAVGVPQKIIKYQDEMTEFDSDGKQFTEFVFMTNRPVKFVGVLECSLPFTLAHWKMMDSGIHIGLRTGPEGDRKFSFSLESPLWEPSSPLLMTLVSTKREDCNFTLRGQP